MAVRSSEHISRVIGLHRRHSLYSLSSFKFSWWAPKDARISKQSVMALQGHPRPLILAPIESAYATYYSLSIVTLVLSCLVSEILQVFCWKQHPTPNPPEFSGFPLDYTADVVAPRSEHPKLIIRVINFELVQPICSAYHNVTDRQTDGRTDGRTDDLR